MAGQTSHINGTVDVAAQASAYSGTVTVGDGGLYGTCDSGACHDAAVDPAWNATPSLLGCSDCHYNTLDVNSFNGQDETASAVATGTASSEWTGRGHGAKSIACLDCHAMSQAHDFTAALSNANAFRLTTGFTCTDNAANCHDGNPTASVATVVNHSKTAMSIAGYNTQVDSWSITPKCVDCHDPHGDASNLKMIQTDLWDNGSSTMSTTVGVPTNHGAIGNSNLAFVNDTTGVSTAGDSYADADAPFSSLCQECHETVDADMTSFQDDATASSTGHPSPGGNPGDCSDCHKHDTAFKPSGCSALKISIDLLI
ncbi:MAG: hypothetical protein P1S59_14440 [bacterium]|nr:hypothetical protein [bacterium]